MERSLAAALQAVGETASVRATRDLSGGCIHRVVEVTLASGRRLVAKLNRPGLAALFAEESASLGALAATDTVPVPTPLANGVFADHAVLLMTAIEVGQPSTRAWQRLGEDLAALHGHDMGTRYGFDTDNHCGATPQPNGWSVDWVAFNAEHRLGHQLRLARESDLLDRGEGSAIQKVIDGLDRWIPRDPHPALLHGDLWSGNALPTGDGRVAVIDPACYVGDGWADIAMMHLFGGFSAACFEAYAAVIDEPDDVRDRIAVYQLYHVLNHVNLFGRGYAGQALRLARSLA